MIGRNRDLLFIQQKMKIRSHTAENSANHIISFQCCYSQYVMNLIYLKGLAQLLLRQVATMKHGHMARRFAPAFRALGVYEHT